MLFEHGFILTKPIWALICLHDITRQIIAALTDHFADDFVRENVARVCDYVATFESLRLTPFCLEKSSVRYLMFKRCFQCSLGLNQVKYARITINIFVSLH